MSNFALALRPQGLADQQILHAWKLVAARPTWKVTDVLPRNLVLAALFILHVAKVDPYDHPFSKRRPNDITISEGRRMVNESFGNWVKCSCGEFQDNGRWCGREWNFANDEWGLCREEGQLSDCVAVHWSAVARAQRWTRKTAQASGFPQEADEVFCRNRLRFGETRQEALTLEQAQQTGFIGLS